MVWTGTCMPITTTIMLCAGQVCSATKDVFDKAFSIFGQSVAIGVSYGSCREDYTNKEATRFAGAVPPGLPGAGSAVHCSTEQESQAALLGMLHHICSEALCTSVVQSHRMPVHVYVAAPVCYQ